MVFFFLSRPPVPPVWPRSRAPLRLSRLRRVFDSRKCKINFIFPQALKVRVSPPHAYASVLRIFLAWPRLPDWHTLLCSCLQIPISVKNVSRLQSQTGNRNLPASFLSFLFLLVCFFCFFLAINSTFARFVPKPSSLCLAAYQHTCIHECAEEGASAGMNRWIDRGRGGGRDTNSPLS